MHLRHRWFEVERIGVIVTERCTVCPKTRTRVQAAVAVSAAPGNPGHPTTPANGSETATAAQRSIHGDAVPHRTRRPPDDLDAVDRQPPDYHG
jgi:hypothetical protein